MRKASLANAHTQLGLKTYILKYKDALDPEVDSPISMADAFGQDALRDVIRQMQLSEPRFDPTPSVAGYVKGECPQGIVDSSQI